MKRLLRKMESREERKGEEEERKRGVGYDEFVYL